ncbi:M50 family metallopeptidase [Mumia sp. Pv 4-285]|uniref:M50 family metallopeptidase n=1 Tax=Mumia qirimensis TaxID=3234852 RepID=UPI00351DA153
MTTDDVISRLATTDPTAFTSTDVAVWAFAVGIAAALVVDPQWRRTSVVVTVAHELGHALGGVFAGRKLTALRIRLDASGVTHTRGKSSGFGMVVCAWAGYPAPAIAGLLAVLVAVRGWAAPGLFVLAILFAVCLFWARSAFTVLVLLACVAGAGALWWWGSEGVQSGTAVGVGAFLVLGGFRAVVDTWRSRQWHRSRGESDAVALEMLTRVPASVWLASFWLATAACAGGAVWMLWATSAQALG